IQEELPLSTRVHELAKELGLKSQELLDRIQSEGLGVKPSPLASLDPETVLRIRQLVVGPTKSAPPAAPTVAKSAPRSLETPAIATTAPAPPSRGPVPTPAASAPVPATAEPTGPRPGLARPPRRRGPAPPRRAGRLHGPGRAAPAPGASRPGRAHPRGDGRPRAPARTGLRPTSRWPDRAPTGRGTALEAHAPPSR